MRMFSVVISVTAVSTYLLQSTPMFVDAVMQSMRNSILLCVNAVVSTRLG
jgi:hypothetical protein